MKLVRRYGCTSTSSNRNRKQKKNENLSFWCEDIYSKKKREKKIEYGQLWMRSKSHCKIFTRGERE
jgi:hypothetical protein